MTPNHQAKKTLNSTFLRTCRQRRSVHYHCSKILFPQSAESQPSHEEGHPVALPRFTVRRIQFHPTIGSNLLSRTSAFSAALFFFFFSFFTVEIVWFIWGCIALAAAAIKPEVEHTWNTLPVLPCPIGVRKRKLLAFEVDILLWTLGIFFVLIQQQLVSFTSGKNWLIQKPIPILYTSEGVYL